MEHNQNLPSRKAQQIGGLFILLVSSGFIAWTWWTALVNGYYYPKAAIIFPPFFFIGLGLVLFPDYRTERITRGEDVSQLSGLSLLTARWWMILIGGLLLGFGNFALIRSLEILLPIPNLP